MENIILSLLLIKSMTIYEIRGFIAHSLSSVCSDSLGSIQAAIKKLLSSEDIIYREFTEKGLNKKEYSITKRGLVKFEKWIQVPINIQKVKNMEEGKLFFLGMASKEVRIQSLRGYLDSLKLEQVKLLQIQAFIEANKESAIDVNVRRIQEDEVLHQHILQVSREETLERAVKNIYQYQLYCLEYGLERLQSDIAFYENIVQREEREEREETQEREAREERQQTE
jgi:DNA-binding PadR family transcriptional regulator